MAAGCERPNDSEGPQSRFAGEGRSDSGACSPDGKSGELKLKYVVKQKAPNKKSG